MMTCTDGARIGETMLPDAVVEVDARGRACPEPVLAARAALEPLAPGVRVRVLLTDPLGPADLAAWCARAGHRIVAEQADRVPYEVVIERGARAPQDCRGR